MPTAGGSQSASHTSPRSTVACHPLLRVLERSRPCQLRQNPGLPRPQLRLREPVAPPESPRTEAGEGLAQGVPRRRPRGRVRPRPRLLHNTALWPAYFPREYLEPTLEALRAHELNNTLYDFHGYWSQHAVRAQPDQSAVSLYRAKKWRRVRRHKDRTLLVVFNNTSYEGPVKLTVEWAAVGYPDPTELRIGSCSQDAPVASNGNEL